MLQALNLISNFSGAAVYFSLSHLILTYSIWCSFFLCMGEVCVRLAVHIEYRINPLCKLLQIYEL
jgi:hypothetical protein